MYCCEVSWFGVKVKIKIKKKKIKIKQNYITSIVSMAKTISYENDNWKFT